MEDKNYFSGLYKVDVRPKTKAKNGLSYLSWAAAWAEVKKLHPEATFKIYTQKFDITTEVENHTQTTTYERPWFDDGKTGWARVGVTIDGTEHVIDLPVMDLKNKPIPAADITSQNANKTVMRALTKACALHGLGLYIYEGEDLPEDSKMVAKLQRECWDLFCARAKISEAAKTKANELCKAADESGDPRQITDAEILTKLKKELMAVRK